MARTPTVRASAVKGASSSVKKGASSSVKKGASQNSNEGVSSTRKKHPEFALVVPKNSGIARQAADKADRSSTIRRARLRQVLVETSGHDIDETQAVGLSKLPMPRLQSLFALSCEQGIFLAVAAPLETQPIVKFGLAQRLPTEWLLPHDEARAFLVSEPVALRDDLKANVYVAFIPMVSLAEADVLTGEQSFGGQTISGQLATCNCTVDYYRKANPQGLANRLLRLESLFKRSFERVLPETHPLRKGFEDIVMRKAQAEKEAEQRSTPINPAVAMPEIPADLNDLRERFFSDPGNESLAQEFGKKLLSHERKGAAQEESSSATHLQDDSVEAFLIEKVLFAFSLSVAQARGQQARELAKPKQRAAPVAKTSTRKSGAKRST